MNNPKHLPGPWDYVVTEGLTMHQYYAGLAMQGLLANTRITDGATLMGSRNIDYENIASKASKAADALINELNKTPEDV